MDAPTDTDHHAARRRWMGLCATAAPAELAARLDARGPRPAFAWLRAPEVGTAMVRGRAGAVGAAFNLGEVSVTRASLRLETGTVGHAYVQGRDTAHAECAALIDALMQTEAAPEIEAEVLAPLEAARHTARAARAAKADATRVEFFTMVRGE